MVENGLVVQRRVDRSVNFFRDWTNYKNNFGQLQNEFWLGNENSVGIYKYAKCKQFQLANKNWQYVLHIDKHSGTANDSNLIAN